VAQSPASQHVERGGETRARFQRTVGQPVIDPRTIRFGLNPDLADFLVKVCARSALIALICLRSLVVVNSRL
jgi:hypothetical protein